MSTEILLESGTNELEILEFTIGGNHYGINVAKVKEILPYREPTPVPNAHPAVEGLFMPREQIITIIDLTVCLNIKNKTRNDNGMYILTNFNKLSVAFHVDKVVGIHRVSWEEIVKPDKTINVAGKGIATGIIKLEQQLIIILDFEKIVSDISPETGLKVSDIEHLKGRKKTEIPILISEDSPLLSTLITDCLHKAGYTNVYATANGKEAWDKLKEYKGQKNILDKVSCIITDIEMPQMDGHRLTKLVKEDEELREIPVIIFSSLITDEMRRKGEALGADAQLTKPEIGSLIETMDEIIAKKYGSNASPQ